MAISSASANGLQPIGGITGVPYFTADVQPFADPLQRHGGTVDELHGNIGEAAEPYPWEEFAGPHQVHGPADDAMLGNLPENRTLPAGDISQDPSGDQTPYYTHAGPTVHGFGRDRGPEGTARHLQQSYAAHSVRTNAAEKAKASSNPLQDEWDGFFSVVPGSDLITNSNRDGQVGPASFGFGVNDHTSNDFPKVNGFGFNMAHRHRRFATGAIPGNTMWMRPGGRVMLKHMSGTARPPVGIGPFQGQDAQASYGVEGAILMATPTEYVPPAQPYVVPQAYDETSNSPSIPLW